MAHPVFPDITPSVGTKHKTIFNVLKANFGDGYSQRAINGLNSARQEWTVVWQQLSETDADTVTDFLDARLGAETFDWTTPLGALKTFSNPDGYTKVNTVNTNSTITAKFIEQFDL